MTDINSVKLPENASNEETISIMEILLRFVRYWKWFVVGIALALIIVFIYLRYTTPVYSVSSSIILKEAAPNGSSRDGGLQWRFGSG